MLLADLDQLEKKVDALCSHLLPKAGAGPPDSYLSALPPRPELEVAGSTDVLKRFLVTDYIPDPRTTPAH